jgi:hypothetical protein
MAESNVMGTYKFPPNVFNKILDNFSQAVQDGKYHKLDYVFWRKLKTTKNSVRIVVKSDLNGKIFFDIFPDTYIMNSFFADGIDGSFGEYLIDNVCNIFTNDYAIECSEKFLEYKMRRAKKTVEKNNNISKTRDDLDYTKVCAGWNTEFSTAWTISDEEAQKILGELNTTPITIVPDNDCMTGKVASINSNAIFATTLATPDTITLGSQIDAIKDKCAMIDNDYIDDRINKVLNEQNTFNNNVDNKKGNKKMKAFNFDFGPCTTDNIRMSMYGLAVKNANGTWVSYNPESKEIIDVDIFNFDGGKFLYKMPVAIKDIAPGMVIVHNRKAMFVIEVGDSGITVVDPQAGEEKKILPTKNCFNFNFYTRVVSLFDSFMKSPENAPSAENPFGNMWMYMLMDDNQNMSDMLLPMMLMSQNGNTFNGINPMMFMLMDGKQDMKDMIVPMMLMGTMNK